MMIKHLFNNLRNKKFCNYDLQYQIFYKYSNTLLLICMA